MSKDLSQANDPLAQRVREMVEYVRWGKRVGFYHYNRPVEALLDKGWVRVNGQKKLMLASYSYLGLIGHPRIVAAAKAAVDKYGTGTHGVRTLAGSLPVHQELEETIAAFKGTEAAIVFSSGYVTNVAVISSLVRRGDVVITDKYNHASIVDGILLSGAKMLRFPHNDMEALERRLQQAPAGASKLVVADAVFSMDGDIINLPKVAELCQRYDAWLMIDEAHSVGVLGETGRGIEEHFGLHDVIDIKMGTLSKTIPSVGGYIAGKKDLIEHVRHTARGYIFSAALPPAQAAAAAEAFRVILDEPWRVEKLRANTRQFIQGLQARGFDTLNTETAIVPVLCKEDETAYRLTGAAYERGLFVLPVVSPAVPRGLARLRATVMATHEPEDIEWAMDQLAEAAREVGLLQA